MQQGKKGTAYIGAPLKWDFYGSQQMKKCLLTENPKKLNVTKNRPLSDPFVIANFGAISICGGE